jgi:hypothetical protein
VIRGKPTVKGLVSLLAAELGGLRAPVPSGTRSLVLVFSSLEAPDEEVKFGAVIDVTDGPALVPGADQVPVIIRFWADEAAVYATPGAAFTLWYGGLVGQGVVTERADEAASSLRG